MYQCDDYDHVLVRERVAQFRDQLSHMCQCGFDAFAVRADKSVADALKGLAGGRGQVLHVT